MSEDNQFQLLQFLWDKWKHHDDLLYRFSANFWTIQTIGIGIVSFLAKDYIMLASLFLLALGLIGFLFFKPNLKLARTCRNTFNNRIYKILREQKILIKDESWKSIPWDTSNDKHPINLWHTPFPFGNGKKVRGSAKIENLIVLASATEIIIGIVLGIIFIKDTLL